MEPRDIFRNISPLDHRYYLTNRELFERLADYLSEEASVRYCVRVEQALLASHVSRLLSEDQAEAILPEISNLMESIDPSEVYDEEERTHHNIRAVVNVIQRHVPEEAQHLVHLGATSVDILDTSASMRYRDVTVNVILPLLGQLQGALIEIVEREAETVQVGRTHGQHAVPITVGFAFAEYVARLGHSIGVITERVQDLRGKLAGAVGAYNALGVLHPDPVELEKQILEGLGLRAAEHATQIVPPEPLLRLLTEFNIAFGIVANLADDLRNLQRTEIAEMAEQFGSTQVGSSTMPQKRNPWNAEHVKSLWKAFSPRIVSFFMDQISEHQRDLTNSASGRFVSDFITGFASAVARMTKIVERLVVDRERLGDNLRMSGDMVLAEPLYVILAGAGFHDAHERIRQLTIEARQKRESLINVARLDDELWSAIKDSAYHMAGIDAEIYFDNPRNYVGLAADRARAVAELHDNYLQKLKKKWEALAVRTLAKKKDTSES